MWASPDIPFRGPHLYSPRFEKPLVFSPWAMESSVEANVDCPEIKVESPEDKQLEPLLILEEGDEPADLINNGERARTVLRVKKSDEDENDDTIGEDHNIVKREKNDSEVTEAERNEEGDVNPEGQREGKVEGGENISKMDERLSGGTRETAVTPEKMPQDETQVPEETNTDMSTRDKPSAQVDVKLRPKDRLSPEVAKQTRISDSPDALCELLYALQEGRRFNDQRCSFRLEGRRRCYSEPSTPRHSQRVFFSSMTSLQKDEFFDLLATSQGRRLDDQRAELQDIPSVPLPPKPKPKERKSSWKVTEVSRPVPTQKQNEDLYNMIVVSQGQGRIEEQRCAAPGPMDDEDFFSLLLKVQGGRMDEQRTDLKPVQL
ncbi:G-protein-signaling modulator 2 [Triplophysa tibetana]|uniref:G-protein-signaling modulator 2 n=1 Tax=Triplophysa tibetana TaxID=1572043 RepID=A0A5A9N141_9TELE|nr:G-protein-signaling modulator 2 [Triplophysa tibetana]